MKTLEQKIKELELKVNTKVSSRGANGISNDSYPEPPSFGEALSVARNQKNHTNSTSNKSKQISIKDSNNEIQLKRRTTGKSSNSRESNTIQNLNNS